MEHDGCKGCKYENCSPESKECMGCKQNAVDKYKRMTQADRIRSMQLIKKILLCNSKRDIIRILNKHRISVEKSKYC